MSLGAKFVEVDGAADASAAGGYAVEQTEEYKQKQQDRIAQSVAKTDVIITTAQIPGRKAPILLTEEMIASMRKGSVIIDIAASTGGNTPYTKNNETVKANLEVAAGRGIPKWLSLDPTAFKGQVLANPTREDITLEINEQLIVELYSK
jgi:NAD(P) transhydrogenase subunit alpha